MLKTIFEVSILQIEEQQPEQVMGFIQLELGLVLL